MGCDIHIKYERLNHLAYEEVKIDYNRAKDQERPLDYRSYRLFAFLAGIRNYSAIQPIALPRGMPVDPSSDYFDDQDRHSHSWLTLSELLAFDYDVEIEDRRVNGQTLPEGHGRRETYRTYLCKGYFDDLKRLKDAGVDRIVFCFDC